MAPRYPITPCSSVIFQNKEILKRLLCQGHQFLQPSLLHIWMQICVYNAFFVHGALGVWLRDKMNILYMQVENCIDGVWGAVEHLIILHIYLAIVFITLWRFWEHLQVYWNRELWEYLDRFGDANEIVIWVEEVYIYIYIYIYIYTHIYIYIYMRVVSFVLHANGAFIREPRQVIVLSSGCRFVPPQNDS